MNKLSPFALVATALIAAPLFAACSATDDGGDDDLLQGAEEELGGNGHYCPAPYTGGHSSSPKYMYSGAHAAMLAAGVSDSALIQTFGDAPLSVGTHCPEPGVSYSDATDFDPGGSACSRVHALRMHGFAAFYRTPPSFGYHIHAVYAGAPVMKSSLKSQLQSFYAKRNGLVSNTIETHCAITNEEIAAVKAVANGGGGGGGNGPSVSGGGCQPGGTYCGGDKVGGSSNNLYVCNSNNTASSLGACADGCKVRSGTDDICAGSGGCQQGGYYCGGDKVTGNPNVLYKCTGGNGGTVSRVCGDGCRINSGSDDSCK